MLVQPIVLIQHACALGLKRRDGTEQIPHDFKMVIHLPAAPHHITDAGVLAAITGTAGDRSLFKEMDMFPFHLTVTDQVTGSCQRRQTGAHEIGRFPIHSRRLFRARKRPHSSRWNNTFYSLRLLWFPGFHLSFCADHTVTFCQTEAINRKSTVMENPSQCFFCLNFHQSSSSEGLRSVRNRFSARWKSPRIRIFSRSVIRTGSSFISLRIHSSAMPTSAYL